MLVYAAKVLGSIVPTTKKERDNMINVMVNESHECVVTNSFPIAIEKMLETFYEVTGFRFTFDELANNILQTIANEDDLSYQITMFDYMNNHHFKIRIQIGNFAWLGIVHRIRVKRDFFENLDSTKYDSDE